MSDNCYQMTAGRYCSIANLIAQIPETERELVVVLDT